MARVFAYLMSNDLKEITDEGVFKDTSNTIKVALEKTHQKLNETKNLSKTAFEIALTQLI